MQNQTQITGKYLIKLVQFYIDLYPRHALKLKELLERAKHEDISSFEDSPISCESYYETEISLIIDPPDPDDKTGSDWSDFV